MQTIMQWQRWWSGGSRCVAKKKTVDHIDAKNINVQRRASVQQLQRRFENFLANAADKVY